MPDISRRSMLAGSGIAMGAAFAGAPIVASSASAMSYDPSYGAAHLHQYGNPTSFKTLSSLSSAAVMQDIVYVPSTNTLFVSQKVAGSGGSGPSGEPYETTILNRVRMSDGKVLDSMRLIDAGHGLGFEVEMQGSDIWIWLTWQGKTADSGWREYDFVRFKYYPGTWQRGTVTNEFGLRVLLADKQEDASWRSPEALYHFDHAHGWAIERQFHWPKAGQAPTETYKRRTISDIVNNVDRTYGEVTLAATPPTVQGFATMNGTFFRWLGATGTGNSPASGDPIRIEQYNWSTGQMIAVKDYPALSRESNGQWKDGTFEPQGMSAYKDSDGTIALLVGDITGASGSRVYHVSKFAGMGAA